MTEIPLDTCPGSELGTGLIILFYIYFELISFKPDNILVRLG